MSDVLLVADCMESTNVIAKASMVLPTFLLPSDADLILLLIYVLCEETIIATQITTETGKPKISFKKGMIFHSAKVSGWICNSNKVVVCP